MSDSTAHGAHCVVDLFDCPQAPLDDLENVRRIMREAAARSCSTLLGELVHRFEPQGVTVVGMLAESHISIHTWPELGYAAADVFTCGEHGDPEAACEFIARALAAGRFEIRSLDRGLPITGARPPRIPVRVVRTPDVA